jgi:hypothetical protein
MKAVRKIGRQIAQLRRELKAAVKEINGQAARKLAQGNYDASQEMVAFAKSVQQFASETKELNEHWNAIKKRQTGKLRAEITPVWEYYRLVARAISSLGGESSFEEIIDWIAKNAIDELKPGDVLQGKKGLAVWHSAVSKARRPMIKEGFVETVAGKWKLTKSGKNLAVQSSQ